MKTITVSFILLFNFSIYSMNKTKNSFKEQSALGSIILPIEDESILSPKLSSLINLELYKTGKEIFYNPIENKEKITQIIQDKQYNSSERKYKITVRNLLNAQKSIMKDILDKLSITLNHLEPSQNKKLKSILLNLHLIRTKKQLNLSTKNQLYECNKNLCDLYCCILENKIVEDIVFDPIIFENILYENKNNLITKILWKNVIEKPTLHDLEQNRSFCDILIRIQK